MDVTKILTELRQEREQIEEAIMSLERLARGRGRRRGRPPSWMAELDKKIGKAANNKPKPSATKAIGIA
jgi:DNA invertase Pin-like site-specific DNA recombinase